MSAKVTGDDRRLKDLIIAGPHSWRVKYNTRRGEVRFHLLKHQSTDSEAKWSRGISR
jgi:hypothetical protein